MRFVAETETEKAQPGSHHNELAIEPQLPHHQPSCLQEGCMHTQERVKAQASIRTYFLSPRMHDHSEVRKQFNTCVKDQGSKHCERDTGRQRTHHMALLRDPVQVALQLNFPLQSCCMPFQAARRKQAEAKAEKRARRVLQGDETHLLDQEAQSAHHPMCAVRAAARVAPPAHSRANFKHCAHRYMRPNT